jgi:hypothetical protein
MADEPNTETTEPKAPAEASTDKTFTQADLDRVVEDRLSRERKKYEGFDDLKAKATELDEIKEANASEIEKAQIKTTKAEQRAAEAEAKLLRFDVAQEKEVPAKLVPLLTGKTREELEAQASLILENAKPATPDFDGGPRDPAGPAQTPEEEHNEFFLRLMGASN